MNACPEYEFLLIDRAAGELTDAGRLRVERHIAECRACAAEAEAYVKVLSAAALPPRSAEERAALATLAKHTARSWRRHERISSLLQGAAAGVLAAGVAAGLIVLLPARRTAANGPRASDPTVIALERWASPMPLGSDLREGAAETLELDFGEEGER